MAKWGHFSSVLHNFKGLRSWSGSGSKLRSQLWWLGLGQGAAECIMSMKALTKIDVQGCVCMCVCAWVCDRGREGALTGRVILVTGWHKVDSCLLQNHYSIISTPSFESTHTLFQNSNSCQHSQHQLNMSGVSHWFCASHVLQRGEIGVDWLFIADSFHWQHIWLPKVTALRDSSLCYAATVWAGGCDFLL